MTQAPRKIAGGSHSLLALLLCVIVLAAAVESDGTPNDPPLRDCTLAWADGDGEDDPDGPPLTTYAYGALCGRLSTVLFPSHLNIGISVRGGRSQRRPACLQPRAPPRSRELSEATSHPRLIVSGPRSPISSFLHVCSDSVLAALPSAYRVKEVKSLELDTTSNSMRTR
jgi:hypothetical protein